jgi:hypothetical protein
MAHYRVFQGTTTAEQGWSTRRLMRGFEWRWVGVFWFDPFRARWMDPWQMHFAHKWAPLRTEFIGNFADGVVLKGQESTLAGMCDAIISGRQICHANKAVCGRAGDIGISKAAVTGI